MDRGDTLYAPVEGTPPPPAAPDAPAAAPSSYRGDGVGAAPSVAVAQYNPRTGAYMGSDGHLYHLSNVAKPTLPTTWTDLMPGVN